MEFSEQQLEIDVTGLTWWDEWTDKCSLCLEPISEDECPIILWTKDGKRTIKLHDECFMKRAKSVSRPIKINQFVNGDVDKIGKV